MYPTYLYIYFGNFSKNCRRFEYITLPIMFYEHGIKILKLLILIKHSFINTYFTNNYDQELKIYY